MPTRYRTCITDREDDLEDQLAPECELIKSTCIIRDEKYEQIVGYFPNTTGASTAKERLSSLVGVQ